MQWYVVALATIFTVAHLAWEYTHGCVGSHHLFARHDMPAVSNWWGLVILPLLGWVASRFVLHRAAKEPGALSKALSGFFGALLIGTVLSVSYHTGHEQMASYIFFSALFMGLLFRVYRAEYLFGFVLSMAFVFGAVLPTIFALAGAMISAISHFLIRPAFTRAVRWVRN